MEELLGSVAEELEIADKKRKLVPSKTAIDESKPDANDTDQDMADANPQGIGESSSSTDAAPPSTETAGDQIAEGTTRKAEDQLLPDARDLYRSHYSLAGVGSGIGADVQELLRIQG